MDKAHGGTELQMALFEKNVPKVLREKVSLSVSAAVGGARHLKPHIFWAHQSYDQPSVQNLQNQNVQSTIDCFVFVSQWQKKHYVKYLHIPESKSVVIHNAIEPLRKKTKSNGVIKLIYTSTPFRGLDVLLEAFSHVKRPDVELHIYSGMSLYGRPYDDTAFESLYKKAAAMANVFYHGVVPNEEIRKALGEAHIFAYPCTWEETSCLSLIEAMSAGCVAIIPDLGALPETASGFGRLYSYTMNKEEHAQRFVLELTQTIDTLRDTAIQQQLEQQIAYFNEHYSWERRKEEWVSLINNVLRHYG